jgi:Fe2+ transport system protein FeoA
MTLDNVKTNQTAKIIYIEGGWWIRQRLNQLGIFVGGRVQVKRSSAFGGPLIIEFDNSKVAIGRGMAAHIHIEIDEIEISQI